MQEELIHHLWKLKTFDHRDLKTICDKPIKIFKYGTYNHNAGPDFINALIKINDTEWAGHVEMHLKSSDWIAHRHHTDKAYNSVILHVVYTHDKEVKTENGSKPYTLELKSRTPSILLERYKSLLGNKLYVPCQNMIQKLDKNLIKVYMDQLLYERLTRKHNKVNTLLDKSKYDWEHVCYALIMKYMGLKVNRNAFEVLTDYVPYRLLIRVADKRYKMEALLLGQAGLLNKCPDQYTQKLRKEYEHLRTKYKLKSMQGLEWKLARMRPSSFPTIRISQLCGLYHNHTYLFRKIIEKPFVSNIHNLLEQHTSNYWKEHYLPGNRSKSRNKQIGLQARNVLICNAIIPLIFSYACISGKHDLKSRALEMYHEITAEKNKLIKFWDTLGLKSKSAADSQALIELKTQYCDQYKCLNCSIGYNILYK